MSDGSVGDRSFSGLQHKFAENIYATGKGRLRLAVLAADLQPLVASPRPLRVLDIGAGLGQCSMLFAAAGHQVVHTDIAAEMVQQAQQSHQQTGLASAYAYHVAPLQALPQLLAGQQFDVVLCHAVLEWLAEPLQALQVAAQLLQPEGQLSLMFYNRDAKLMANMIYGNFDYVADHLRVKKKVRLSPQQPLDPSRLWREVEALGWQRLLHSGVRCFYDYLRDRADQERFDALLELELRYRQQHPFVHLGRYQHWILRRA